jgi:hypothetical protein
MGYEKSGREGPAVFESCVADSSHHPAAGKGSGPSGGNHIILITSKNYITSLQALRQMPGLPIRRFCPPRFAMLQCRADFSEADEWDFHANALTPAASAPAFPDSKPAIGEFA